MEIFVVPGFGVFGVSGIVLILASLILAGHTWTFDMSTNIEELTLLTGQVLFSLAIVGGVAVGLARFLPRLPLFESMVLGPPSSADVEPQLRTGTTRGDSIYGDGIVVGVRGVSITMLRPSGKGKLDDHIVDVISEGPFIAPESPIEVVSVSGNKIVVRQA
jgi:membrane-bound serine protease (ClpP class)